MPDSARRRTVKRSTPAASWTDANSPTPPGSGARCTTILRPRRVSCGVSILMPPDAPRSAVIWPGYDTLKRASRKTAIGPRISCGGSPRARISTASPRPLPCWPCVMPPLRREPIELRYQVESQARLARNDGRRRHQRRPAVSRLLPRFERRGAGRHGGAAAGLFRHLVLWVRTQPRALGTEDGRAEL